MSNPSIGSALVTGSTSGIGRAAAIQLARAGYDITGTTIAADGGRSAV